MTSLVVYDAPDARGSEIIELLKNRCEGRKKIDFLNLGDADMQPCTGCFQCWVRTPGECIFHDDASRIVREIVNADRVMFLCPVSWGGYSPDLKILLDRAICRALPFFEVYKGETHHPTRYEKNPLTWLIGYGMDLSSGETNLFRKLGENLDDNMQKGGLNVGVINGDTGFDILDSFFNEEKSI